jgi:hypothetical protein
MYGLINKSLKQMILESYGEEKWQAVQAQAGVPPDSYLTLRSYDDEITYQLVDAASHVLGAPAETCLEMFGQYWVREVASKSYEILMNAAGSDMVEFLQNLNGLHDRITTTFIDYVPPSFEIESQGGSRYQLYYRSQREGLSAFVVGLVKGLGERYASKVIFHDQQDLATDAGSHTVFDIEIQPA